MNKGRIIKLLVIIGLFSLWRLFFSSTDTGLQSVHLTGTTMGPIPYSIKYQAQGGRNYQIQVDSILTSYNEALSTYIPSSEISRFNDNDLIQFESPYFYSVLEASKAVFEKTNGAFDPTVGPLVNAWGFGPEKRSKIDSTEIDSIRNIIGFDKIVFDEVEATKLQGMYLDFSAIAKGNGIDVVSNFLESKEIESYMVEIGGEVFGKGTSNSGQPWKIGIQRPVMNSEMGELFATVLLDNKAMATSGNYRNYYIEDGKIVAHTISPFSGYPVTHNLLSASIFAKNCTLADAYATACMVLGLEKSIELVNSIDNLYGFFIYSDESGQLSSFSSDGISKYVELVE